jgi:hypothetical protein
MPRYQRVHMDCYGCQADSERELLNWQVDQRVSGFRDRW